MDESVPHAKSTLTTPKHETILPDTRIIEHLFSIRERASVGALFALSLLLLVPHTHSVLCVRIAIWIIRDEADRTDVDRPEKRDGVQWPYVAEQRWSTAELVKQQFIGRRAPRRNR